MNEDETSCCRTRFRNERETRERGCGATKRTLQRTLELSDRYAKIKELEARIHASEEAAHNEREDRNKIVKGLNEQVHKLKDFVKSADSEVVEREKVGRPISDDHSRERKTKWFSKSRTIENSHEKSLEVERENYSKHKGEFTSGEAKLTILWRKNRRR